MQLLEFSDIYNLISKGTEQVAMRQQSRKLRLNTLSTSYSQGFKKVAFDTRRINQETDVNPRRGAQNYQRSEAFITEAMEQKIKNFAKLRQALLSLKEVYGKEHEWQDSNARILLSTIDNGLRTIVQDEDFATNQPGAGSFDYIEELLGVRYRLNIDNLASMGEADLKKVIMAKDEELTRKDVKKVLEITKQDISNQNYDSLISKLFDGCHASAENKDVERTITITIRDRFNKES